MINSLDYALGFTIYHIKHTRVKVSLHDIACTKTDITPLLQAVLERVLRKFACLTKGDTISLNYNSHEYEMCVLECLPADVSVCVYQSSRGTKQ